MAASIGYLVIDSVDPSALAPFWCAMLGTAVDATLGEGEFLVLSPTADGLTVGFQRVAEHKAGKNRLHLDLVVTDIDEATQEVGRLGGRHAPVRSRRPLAPMSALKPAPGRHRRRVRRR